MFEDPKQTAQKLFDRFKDTGSEPDQYGGRNFLHNDEIKGLALNLVATLLEECKAERIDFWQEVKIEIEKL